MSRDYDMSIRARQRVRVVRPPRLLLAAAVAALSGCTDAMTRVDREVEALVAETNALIGQTANPDYPVGTRPVALDPEGRGSVRFESQPATVNPAASALRFSTAPDQEASEVIARLEGYANLPDDAIVLDLPDALAYSLDHSREFRFAEEELVLASLRLLIERHLWGPRFFNDVEATILGDGDDNAYDTSLRVVNDFELTQRLPYGGSVSARALARAVEDLHGRVVGENVQDAEIILSADVPLLRGAGLTARETRIQRERDMVYAARDFARFRRQFLFDITRDFLTLVVREQAITNAEIGVASFQQVEREQQALYRAGRSTPFDTAEAQNRTLDQIDTLNTQRENFRLAIDRFKVRLGMPIGQAMTIDASTLEFPNPEIDMSGAIRMAMDYRLDLQTQRDVVGDARRGVDNAKNDLLGDLSLNAQVRLPTDDERDRSGLRFNTEDVEFQAGITYGIPLDREIERLQLRQADIALDRSIRAYDRFRDDIAVSVRGAVRGIDSALFSLQIQETNVEIALQREASIKADPARADIRQKTDAIQQTLRARDRRDEARRDLDVAILFYLLETGQLRVADDGSFQPLPGM